MEPCEIEFLGENKLIEITPNFNFGQVHLIAGSFGPFRAGLPMSVPIWLAMSLKQQQKCRIMCPDWMDLVNLEAIKECEKERANELTLMPDDHYMDIAHIVLDSASEDIKNIDNIRTLIKDIWDIRTSKLRTIINELFKEYSATYVKLDNITPMEIASIRPLLPQTMDQFLKIQRCDERSSRTN